MQPIPRPVTNVSVYPYLPNIPIVVQPVFVDGKGTFSAGSLGTHLFYNLDLSSGEPKHGGVVAGNQYYATYTDADGNPQQTPWMQAQQGGDAPKFGRTITALGGPQTSAAPTPDIAYQLHLVDVTVSLAHDPREPIEIPLIEGAKAIASFAGLLPGGAWSVSVSGGTRPNPLAVGMTVTISGKLANSGKGYAIPAVLSCTNDGDPATFSSKKA